MTRIPPSRGTTLLEVLAALALVAGVVLSIAGLATTAGRLSRGGFRTTVAVLAARGVLEELHGRSFRETYRRFGCDPDSERCTVGSADPIVAGWIAPLAVGARDATAELEIRAVDAPTLQAASTLRVSLTLRWWEGLRKRTVRLISVRA